MEVKSNQQIICIFSGVASSRRLPGKMEVYLNKNRPEMYKALLEHHRLAKVKEEDMDFSKMDSETT